MAVERAALALAQSDLRTALAIYVHELGDWDAGEEAALARAADGGVLAFLQLCMSPEASKVDATINPTARALYALESSARSGLGVAGSAAIEALPDTLPLSTVNSYLHRAIRSATARRRDLAIRAALARRAELASHLTALQAQAASHTVDAGRVCPVCGRRLGDGVLAAFPSGALVHFACFDRNKPWLDPVTKADLRSVE